MVQKMMMYVEFTQVTKQEDAKRVSKNRQTMSLYLHLRFYGFPAQSPTQSRQSVNCRHNTYCSYVPLMTHTVLRLIYQTDIQDPYSVPRCWGRQSSVSATVDLPPRSRRRCVVVRRSSFVRSFVRSFVVVVDGVVVGVQLSSKSRPLPLPRSSLVPLLLLVWCLPWAAVVSSDAAADEDYGDGVAADADADADEAAAVVRLLSSSYRVRTSPPPIERRQR